MPVEIFVDVNAAVNAFAVSVGADGILWPVETHANVKVVVERDNLIDIERVSEILSLSKSTVWGLISADTLPKPIRIGRCVRWREIEIHAWVAAGCPPVSKWDLTRKQAINEYETARRRK